MSLTRLRRLAPWLLWIPLTLSPVQAGPPDARAQLADKLFAAWDRTDSPGCALAVIQDGKILHARGFGMASLEQNVPITTTTLFNIASISKQFTCFVILLLAQAGLLSLDDDIRAHLPEVPDFGQKITIRHLMHHTSGLREDGVLLHLAGWRSEDVVRESDVLDLVRRQKELNFPPGQEYMYCNTGYDLLAAIVKRVSGKSLREYTREKVLLPLGMNSSVFCDDYRLVIPKRAQSYRPKKGGGFEQVHFMHERTGASNLFTSVEDLAKWDRNFYDARVGGQELVTRMQEKGRLSSGKMIPYAAGLRIGEYRGLKIVEHQGATAGYRSTLLRFPEQRFTVMVLANVTPFNAGTLARRVADIYLEGKLGEPAFRPAAEKIPPAVLEKWAGHYRLSTGEILTFTRDGNRLALRALLGVTGLKAASENEFYEEEFEVRFTFNGDGKTRKVIQRSAFGELVGERIDPKTPTRAELAACAGEYRSPELDTIYTLLELGGKLVLRHRKGTVALEPLGQDEFKMETEMAMALRLTRANSGQVNGFTLGGTRFRNLRFQKVEVRNVPGTAGTRNGWQAGSHGE